MAAVKKLFCIENLDYIMKTCLMVLMIVYVIMPIDLMPGPVDDTIVLILGLFGTRFFEQMPELHDFDKVDQ